MSKWTVLVYMAADNNGLDTSEDVVGMKAAALDAGVDVIVETVGQGGQMTRWKIARNDQQRLPGPAVRVDTGKPGPLTDFIRWGLREYPADNAAVIVWTHGDGLELAPAVLRGKWGSPRALTDHLTVKQLAQAFHEAGLKRGLIGLDACLMSTTEVAYELRDAGAYLVASEPDELSPWPYTEILTRLAQSATMSPDVLAQTIVGACGDAFAASGVATTSIASMALGQLNDVAASFKELVKAIGVRAESMKKVREARARVPSLSYHGYVDLKRFLRELQASEVAAPQVAALQAALGKAMTSCRTSGAAAADYGGLSLFYPTAKVSSALDLYSTLQFPKATGWGALLNRLIA